MTEGLDLHLGVDKTAGFVERALETALREAIRSGRLHAGARLPVRDAPEWAVLRYGLLYGPGTWYSRGGLMADQAARGELAADGDVGSFVHVDDAAGAAADALSWPTG